MKNNDMNLFNVEQDLLVYKDEPEWFKQCLLKACIKELGGSIRHMQYVDYHEELNEKKAVVTTLKHIRSVALEANNYVDDILKPNSPNINLDTCIILIPDTEHPGDFMEPISNLKINSGDLKGYDVDEIYDYTMGRKQLLILNDQNSIKPFGYVDKDILKMWKESTIPYKEELLQHLNTLQNVTKDNFGTSAIEKEEVISTLKSSLK